MRKKAKNTFNFFVHRHRYDHFMFFVIQSSLCNICICQNQFNFVSRFFDTRIYIYIAQTTPAALLLFLLFKCVLEFLQRLKLNLANFEENLQRQVVQVGHSKNLISTTSHSFTIYFVFQLLPLGQWIFTVFRNKTSNIIKFVLN